MTRLYGTTEWNDDLKLILRHAVTALDQHVVFLFNDSEVNNYLIFLYFFVIIYIKCMQIKMEGMIEDINNLLNSGEVPNLYAIDEKIELCDKIRIIDKQRDKSLQVFIYIMLHIF